LIIGKNTKTTSSNPEPEGNDDPDCLYPTFDGSYVAQDGTAFAQWSPGLRRSSISSVLDIVSYKLEGLSRRSSSSGGYDDPVGSMTPLYRPQRNVSTGSGLSAATSSSGEYDNPIGRMEDEEVPQNPKPETGGITSPASISERPASPGSDFSDVQMRGDARMAQVIEPSNSESDEEFVKRDEQRTRQAEEQRRDSRAGSESSEEFAMRDAQGATPQIRQHAYKPAVPIIPPSGRIQPPEDDASKSPAAKSEHKNERASWDHAYIPMPRNGPFPAPDARLQLVPNTMG